MLVINTFLCTSRFIESYLFCPQGPAGPTGPKGATGGVGAPVSVLSSCEGC